jgi:hypothetical protein
MDPPADVANSESLARFVFRSKDVRADSTLRPDVFIPFPYPDLSVTRHFGLEDREIWEKGHAIGRERSLPLIGSRPGLLRGRRHGRSSVGHCEATERPNRRDSINVSQRVRAISTENSKA